MFPYPIYITHTRQNPPPFSHPRPDYPYYGYRPGPVPQFIYLQHVSAPVPIFVQPVFGYPVSQAPSPTPLPVPAGTPSDVRYEIIGGVFTPVRHFHYNSPASVGRGHNTAHGFDTGSLPPSWGTIPPAPETPATREPAPASSQPVAGNGDGASTGPGDIAPASSVAPATNTTDEPAPSPGSSKEKAPPRPPPPTVEDESKQGNGDQASSGGSEGAAKKDGQGASGSGAQKDS